MVIVDAGLAGVELWGWDPFNVVVLVDPRFPAAGTDHAVVGPTREAELIDVGLSVVGPVASRVMDLAAVGGPGAARLGAASVAGDEHDSLGRGGHAAGAEKVQRRSGGLVEHRQPMGGVCGHPDDVCDGNDG